MDHPTVARTTQRAVVAALVIACIAGGAGPVGGQEGAATTPFAPGEVLSYRAVSSRFGTFGSGTMRVDGPVDVRGVPALQLSFDFRGRVGIFKVEDRTRSWIGTGDHLSLRFQRNERSPLGSKGEKVEIYPDEGRWEGLNGLSGETACQHPLDELSFLYYIRSLPLDDGDEYSLAHHFDPERNPVTVRVLRREQVTVPAGEFATVVVEMNVSDKRVSAMRLFLTDDATRIPVRIESSAPWVGSTRLLLVGIGGAAVAAR